MQGPYVLLARPRLERHICHRLRNVGQRVVGASQTATAHPLVLPQVLTVVANTVGGVAGKMISPQSIAIACAAVAVAGEESDLFRFTAKHSLIFAVMIGALTTFQAYVVPWMIPGH